MQEIIVTSEYLDHRLTDWATWFRSRPDEGGPKVPNCNLLYRFRNEGIVHYQVAPKSFECNQQAEDMEEWIKELAQYDNKYAEAVRMKYLNHSPYLTERKLEQRLAEKLGISPRRLQERLHHARLWLAGRMQSVAVVRVKNIAQPIACAA